MRSIYEQSANGLIRDVVVAGGRLTWLPHWAHEGACLRDVIYALARANACATYDVTRLCLRRADESPSHVSHAVQRLDPLVPVGLDLARLADLMRIRVRSLWLGTCLPLAEAWIPIDRFLTGQTHRRRFFAGALSPTLRFCRLCLRHGRHTPLHQLLPLEYCTLHENPVRLSDRCPRCDRTTPFYVSRSFVEGEPDPRWHCSTCKAFLGEGAVDEPNRPSPECIVASFWIMRLWEQVTDPAWSLLPLPVIAAAVKAEIDRRRAMSLSVWRTPIHHAHVARFIRPPKGRWGTITLVDLLDLLRQLELDLAAIRGASESSVADLAPREDEERRSAVVTAIRSGEAANQIQKRLHLARPTFYADVRAAVEEGVLDVTEAETYAYRPRASRPEVDNVRSLLAAGESVAEVVEQTGLLESTVEAMAWRIHRGFASVAYLTSYPTSRRLLPSNLSDRERQRQDLWQVIERLDREGPEPVTIARIDTEFGRKFLIERIRRNYGPFAGSGGTEFAERVRRRILDSWIRRYPNPGSLDVALAHWRHRLLRGWAQELGYIPAKTPALRRARDPQPQSSKAKHPREPSTSKLTDVAKIGDALECARCSGAECRPCGSAHGKTRYRCTQCGLVFLPTMGTPFHSLHTPPREVVRTILAVRRLGSVPAVEAETGHKRRTIAAWLRRIEAQSGGVTEASLKGFGICEGEIQEFLSFVHQ